MIDISAVRWAKYRNFEGPVFAGNMPVPKAGRSAPFHAKVLAITAAAEGGGFNATQMWDSGLLSAGAIQFIDVGSFNVCNLLGEVADKCGAGLVEEKLRPALDMCNASFGKTNDGKWRFSQNGVMVNTAAAQKMLYFGDAAGNALGSYDDKKRLRVKTWVACVANVWDIPGACDVQMEFTLRNLKSGFVWGTLKSELFAEGVSEEGYVGATKAMLLAYAVNAPAVVVKMYDAARNNGKEKFTPEWCLEVLRHVVVNGGVDVWKARWGAKVPLVESAFGVKLPTYNDLAARKWSVLEPSPASAVVEQNAEPEPAPIVHPIPDFEPTPTPVEPEPTSAPIVVAGQPWLAFALSFIKLLVDIFTRVFKR